MFFWCRTTPRSEITGSWFCLGAVKRLRNSLSMQLQKHIAKWTVGGATNAIHDYQFLSALVNHYRCWRITVTVRYNAASSRWSHRRNLARPTGRSPRSKSQHNCMTGAWRVWFLLHKSAENVAIGREYKLFLLFVMDCRLIHNHCRWRVTWRTNANGLFHLISVPPLWMIFQCLSQGVLTC